MNPEIQEEEIEILEYMRKYPNFSFSSARLSRIFNTGSVRISKLLLELYKMGYLEKRYRGSAKRKAFYKWKIRK